MIGRTHRFHGHSSLHYVYQHGKTVRTPLCSLRYIKNTRRTTYRAAVVVSKKMSKSAVVRNRIRRRIYEVVRLHVSEADSYDLVFTVFSDHLATIETEKLQESILELLRSADIVAS